ncbi:MAG: hypothetical protein CVV24_05160 [Ignavibacteriae bacterium HGW-Ignavibacteriae-3]|nr:MAG: hypothetical protein CVV24_05160 [Ignavibacteriae bacterium HGW-Ignavibacteriae-3]
MSKQQNKKVLITELIILVTLLIISFLLWDTYFVYPIKLCAVLLHELSHAVAGIVSGGAIVEMNIGFDLGGKCVIEGGNTILIASAGYLGSLFLGLILFISPNNKKTGFWVINLISATIFLLSVFTASNTVFIILALLLSSLLTASSFYMKIPIVTIFIRAFGLISCVYVLFDIKEDILSNNYQISDASILSGMIDLPAAIIGISWGIISIAAIYFAMRVSYKN